MKYLLRQKNFLIINIYRKSRDTACRISVLIMMAITKESFSRYIKAFQFRELFNDMGWNNDRTKQPIIVDDETYNLTGIAEKSGFRIFTCVPAAGNKLPDSTTRKKLEGKVTKLFQEHLIIFIDEHKQEQVWQLAVRKVGSPTKISETRYSLSQDPELLYQRASGLFFTLDEEEKVTIIDVTKRVADNFQQNNERVTKKFYESFKREHTAFLKFIKGIDDQLNMDWYASLMLNRLMFCYFIQKKGFLDNNKNYLQDKLKACKEKKGKNQFYSFYRDFLLALFHKGLGAPEHSKNIEVEIGKIPYLNGGLFDEHQIEKTFKKIEIDDKAFEQLFNFFDEWEWHLDTRESASGKDVNPDVIGYIFEKYINDRAQMGAYYTKEDITDYISKNCIIPWLFDEVKRQYSRGRFDTCPFANGGWLWQMVKTSGDEYIYDAVKYGVPVGADLCVCPDNINGQPPITGQPQGLPLHCSMTCPLKSKKASRRNWERRWLTATVPGSGNSAKVGTNQRHRILRCRPRFTAKSLNGANGMRTSGQKLKVAKSKKSMISSPIISISASSCRMCWKRPMMPSLSATFTRHYCA